MNSAETIHEIIEKKDFSEANITFLLGLEGPESQILQKYADAETIKNFKNKVFFRGLIELSNICKKDCLYCGIRKSNKHVYRYELSKKEIVEAAKFAIKNNFGSIVLQSGERSDKVLIKKINELLQIIKKESNGELGITLSLGEQSEDTYRNWFENGAHRYLLRIETTNRELYKKIHPETNDHSFEKRLECLKILRNIGYQVGTGVMIGLPEQTLNDLAKDILFYKSIDIDMVGMGPYIEHENTPLYEKKHLLQPAQKRFELTLNMIAVLRLFMPDINIAAATALQAVKDSGREMALLCGANIVMPNITPSENRNNYQLYKNKPRINEGSEKTLAELLTRINKTGKKVTFNEWGDSLHFFKR